MVRIDENTYIAKDDIAAIQNEEIWDYSGSPSDGSSYLKFKGSRIVLKNGRKIFVEGMTPQEIIAKLEQNND